MRRLAFVTTIIILACLMLASCTAGKTTATEIGELPDMIMENARYTIASGSETPLVIDAARITIYSGNNARTLLEELKFTGEPSISGHCNSASVTDGETVVTLSGNVLFSSTEDEMEISCDGLTWNRNTGTLVTDGEVSVKYGDGTTIRAIGLTATPDKDVYEFAEILEGSIEID